MLNNFKFNQILHSGMDMWKIFAKFRENRLKFSKLIQFRIKFYKFV